MRLPDFLIIGAMKSGTTTLYRDLLTNPAVFMPADKEPWTLTRDEVLQPEGLQLYAKLFQKAGPRQICGEASTVYSQMPEFPGVPQRARTVCGDRLKIIFIVREPVSHIISHYHHGLTSEAISCDIDTAVRTISTLLGYSRFALQITPWIEEFGREQVLILRFESYISDRRGTVAEVCEFLGIEPRSDLLQADVAFNRSARKPLPRGPFAFLRHSFLYRRMVRPILWPAARDKLRHALLPKASAEVAPPSLDTVRYIIDELRNDAEQLRVIMGRDKPVWDSDETLQRYGRELAPA